MTIIYDMPAADYHANPAISKSGLDLIARSPAHFKYAPPRKETDAMRLGTATHAAILEPARYASEFPVAMGAKDRKAAQYKDLVEAHGKGRVLMPDEAASVCLMARAVRGTPEIAEVLSLEGSAEVSVFATDPVTGLAVRIRIDWLTKCLRALDLKTTKDLRNDQFARSVIDYRYHVQQAFYTDVFMWATGERLQFDFALTESAEPHVSKRMSLPDDLVAYGRHLYRRDLNLYADCLAHDVWPGPETEILTLIPPQWLLYKMEDELGGMITNGEPA